MTDPTVVARLHGMLETVRALSEDDNPIVKVSAERIGVIIVDALLELDPTNFDDPWDSLPTVRSRT